MENQKSNHELSVEQIKDLLKPIHDFLDNYNFINEKEKLNSNEVRKDKGV